MPKPVAIRVSYRSDAAFLLRLVEAIDKDVRRPEPWRRQVKDLALRFVRKLLSAEQLSVAVVNKDVSRRRR